MINLHTGFRYGFFFREKTTTIIEFLSFSLSGAYKPEGLEERSPDAIASHVVSIKLTYQNSLVHGGTWAFMGVCVGDGALKWTLSWTGYVFPHTMN